MLHAALLLFSPLPVQSQLPALPPLAESGAEAIRFLLAPALRRGDRIAVTVTPGPRGRAEARIELRQRRCAGAAPSYRCTEEATQTAGARFCIEGECRYSAIARRIAALVARGAPQGPDVEVCTDGPGYRTELRRGGVERSLDGFCGADHPNAAIHALFRAALPAEFARFARREG